MESPLEPIQTAPYSETPKGWASFRQIATNFRLQWPEYFLDIIVIILSLMISFTLDNLKEESGKKSAEQVYLKGLLDDSTSDQQELKRIIAETKTIIANANELLAMSDEQTTIVTDEFARDIKGVLERPNFISKNATFSDLTSSGNMQLVHDRELKTRLFEYHHLIESVKGIELSERETITTLVAPGLLKHLSIKAIAVGKGSVVRKGKTVEQIVKDEDVINAIALRLANREELLNAYESALRLTADLNLILEKQIK